MEIISNIYINNIKEFLIYYKNLGFKVENIFRKNKEILNATISYRNKYIKIFNSKNKTFNSISLYFNKKEKKFVLELIEKFKSSKAKETWKKEESAVGHFYYQLKDPFGLIWNFQKYDIFQPKIINIYSSQLASLMMMGFTNIYQREQRELNYYGNFVKNIETFPNLKFFKYNNKTIKGDYVVIDKNDFKYNKNVIKLGDRKIIANYGWDAKGSEKKSISAGSGYNWEYRNSLIKQYNILVNSLSKERLIDKNIAIKLGEKTHEDNKNYIKKNIKYFEKYNKKSIGFIYHWQSENHYFRKVEFNPKKIALIAPSLIPWVYDDFKMKFPKIPDKKWQSKYFNKYGITDLDKNLTINKFNKKFDIIIYINNEHSRISKKEIEDSKVQSMLKEEGKFIEVNYQDFSSSIKSLFGVKHFIDSLKKIL